MSSKRYPHNFVRCCILLGVGVTRILVLAHEPGHVDGNDRSGLSPMSSPLVHRCGKNYGWSRFEGNYCQVAVEDNEFNPPCEDVDRSGFEFPIYEVKAISCLHH